MTLEDRIKVALSSYKEDLVSREDAIEIITSGLQEHCEGCSHQVYSGDLAAALAVIERAIDDQQKEDSGWTYVSNAAGVECTE